MGDVLLQEVYGHVGLEEMDYFGLQFFDKHDQMVGCLDTSSQMLMHCKSSWCTSL